MPKEILWRPLNCYLLLLRARVDYIIYGNSFYEGTFVESLADSIMTMAIATTSAALRGRSFLGLGFGVETIWKCWNRCF